MFHTARAYSSRQLVMFNPDIPAIQNFKAMPARERRKRDGKKDLPIFLSFFFIRNVGTDYFYVMSIVQLPRGHYYYDKVRSPAGFIPITI